MTDGIDFSGRSAGPPTLFDDGLRAKITELEEENARLRAENFRLLNDPGKNTAGKATRESEESRLAALREMPRTGTRRAFVLDVLIAKYPDGWSDEQIKYRVWLAFQVQMDIRSVNARRKELEEGGWVVKAGWKVHAPSGNDVSVWTLSPTAAEILVAR